MEDEIFIAKYVAGRFGTEELVEFANRKLVSGVYSDYLLAILDESPKIWIAVSEYFERAIDEFGYKIPSFEEAIWKLLRYHISLISTGKVNPVEQFRQLLLDINRFNLHKGINEYVGDNIGIARMYGWFYDDYSSSTEIENGIFTESIKWLHEHESMH